MWPNVAPLRCCHLHFFLPVLGCPTFFLVLALCSPQATTNMRRCRLWQSNAIFGQNSLRAQEELAFQAKGRTPGMPRKERKDMRPIRVIHETKRVLLAGRNRVNAFGGNQYVVASRKTNDAMLVDAADDWPEDWVGFLKASGLRLTTIAFTHLHMDNLLGFTTLSDAFPDAKLAFSLSDEGWIDKFGVTCDRYGRRDVAASGLPFHRHSVEIFSAVAHRSQPDVLLGDIPVFQIPTPGHSMGHTMLHLPQDRLLFSGDSLVHGEVGRVDLPWASGVMQAASLRKLEDIADEVVLLPGHGRLTTMGAERKNNLGLRRLYELIAAGKQEISVGLNGRGNF